MSYRIEFASSAKKELAKLVKKIQPKQAKRIRDAIESLKEDPRPHYVEKLTDSENLWRVRAGDYRIVYEIEDDVLLVYVVTIADRKDVYRGR